MPRLAVIVATLAVLAGGAQAAADEWASYGRDPQGTRYSPLTQINPGNVAQLKPAWTYHTGDVADGTAGTARSGFETTPLVADGRLYLTTPFNRIIALDAATGTELWAFDPAIDKTAPYGDGLINRGLALWRESRNRKKECAVRLFEATLDARLIAVDAVTGAPCRQFGRGGEVSLRGVPNYRAGWYHMTSPPIVVDGVVIVGSSINDNMRTDMPDGMVRGFDARTGQLRWQWQPIQRPTGVAADAWETGGGNAWSILSADPSRGLVFVPTGSASPDYYGHSRGGDNRWANSVVALNAKTGRLAWGFQLVHHDLWDYDTAAAPLLTTFKIKGYRKRALIAGNKTGMLYVLDPDTGKPVLPIEERAVPMSRAAGEDTAATQPFPTSLPTLVPRSMTHAWGMTDEDRKACELDLADMTGAALFTPPSVNGSLTIPGVLGGINWSGFAWDARRERLIVAVSNLPYRVRLVPSDKVSDPKAGFPGAEIAPQSGTPFGVARAPFRARSGLPCAEPPWGELIAIDLAGGKIAWRKPVGSMAEVFAGPPDSGSVLLGGPIVTASGLIFIGGSMDRRLHALSSDSGEELWTAALPASGHALPITYQIGAKQYVVIAAGGAAKITEEAQSDAVMAFALP